jgi:hypothetical protein
MQKHSFMEITGCYKRKTVKAFILGFSHADRHPMICLGRVRFYFNLVQSDYSLLRNIFWYIFQVMLLTILLSLQQSRSISVKPVQQSLIIFAGYVMRSSHVQLHMQRIKLCIIPLSVISGKIKFCMVMIPEIRVALIVLRQLGNLQLVNTNR